jgi:hypothetical protein
MVWLKITLKIKIALIIVLLGSITMQLFNKKSSQIDGMGGIIYIFNVSQSRSGRGIFECSSSGARCLYNKVGFRCGLRKYMRAPHYRWQHLSNSKRIQVTRRSLRDKWPLQPLALVVCSCEVSSKLLVASWLRLNLVSINGCFSKNGT